MEDNRLSDLGIIHIERMQSTNIDLDEFVDVFANHHSNRRISLI